MVSIMTPEMESDLRGKAIIIFMHLLGMKEVTFNNDDLRVAGSGEGEVDLTMAVDRKNSTLTIRVGSVQND